jgi:transcriptional regulator with XRE-family HTH domain
MTNLRKLLALNMREKRHSLGYSQAKLAEIVNTAPTYIAMIELGKKFPSVEMLERLAAALGMDTPELFSMSAIPAESIKQLHESVLKDFEKIINGKLRAIQS